ncbi:MAG TPA: zinc metalloprotease HtpX [Spirochaetota bacterium]|nr:zinc metalloprotease HtpX [Spirochaetota bacterium]
MNRERLIYNSVRNTVQSFFLMLLMIVIPGTVGLLIAGIQGMLIAVFGGVILLFSGPKISPPLVLKMYNARKLSPAEAGGLHRILHELASRSHLPKMPALYYIPSRVLNAFSVGNREDSAIAITDGLLRALTWRELTAVLAHEVSHIQSGDLRIMGLADTISRFTNVLSHIGIIMILIFLPIMLLTGSLLPLPVLLILIFSPALSIVLQMALSRTREYKADLDAVGLTGDPEGLASALKKLENYKMKLWDLFLMPGRRVPDPSLLRSHPHTEKRIERLIALSAEEGAINHEYDGSPLPLHIPEVHKKPVWRIGGIWK